MPQPPQPSAAPFLQPLPGGGSDPRRRGGGGSGRTFDTGRLVREYALPALGLLVAASLVGPLVGGLVFSALGLGVVIAGAAAFFSLSTVFLPALAAVFGVPALMAGGMAAGARGVVWVGGWCSCGAAGNASCGQRRLGRWAHPLTPPCPPAALARAGVFATAAAGALLLPSLLQLVLVGGGLWLGATAAQQLLGGGQGGQEGGEGFTVGRDGTIDVEASTVDDSDWRNEMFK